MDITHYYRESGAGEPLVLLHGNGENGGYFVHQLSFFAPRRHVIAPDTRGHGQTPRGAAPFTLRQFAEDLAGFLDRLGLPRVHLLGFSDGANIAMLFALSYPERVTKLILNGGNLDPRGVKRSVQLPIELGYRTARAFAGRSSEARAHAELLGLMVNEPHIDPAELQNIRCPTLVIAGTRDMIKRSHTEEIARSIPGAELSFIEGGHFIAKENPTAFNARVERFLSP